MPVAAVLRLALSLSALSASPEPAEPVEAPVRETVVTAARFARPQKETTTFTTVIPRSELENSPDLTPDAWVRSVSSAATFRRTSSLVADPSSQGLNLRGIGPSSVSRGLLLVDGIPANDGFGGWIYWLSLPRLSLDRIEVSPGGASALYGSAALGGVVQMLTRKIEGSSLNAEASYGSHGAWLGAVRMTERYGRLGVSIEANRLGLNGYRVVAPSQQGAVDVAARSDATNLYGKADLELTERATLGLRASFFDQNQYGGTEFTRADVRSYLLGGVASIRQNPGTWNLSLYGKDVTFRQSRARFSEFRATETLASEQVVPSTELGGSATWSSRPRVLFGIHEASVGVDARRVKGSSNEDIFPPGSLTPTARNVSGEQRLVGVFLQDLYRPTERLRLQGDLRFDHWQNRSADTRDRAQSLSPRLGARFQLSSAWVLVGSVYRAFRAPTLNELYRPFQVGTILTDSNPALRAETLWGQELGIETTLPGSTVARVTGFHSALDAPMAVLTLDAPTPSGALRRRENLGGTRSAGFEVSVESRPVRPLSLMLSYSFNDSRVTDAGIGPLTLLDRQLAQAAKHRGNLSASLGNARWGTWTGTMQVVGPQYEDDLNQRRLAGFLVLDARYSRALRAGFSVFIAAENLLNREYLVGRAGVDTIGAPFMARLGLTYRGEGR